MLTKKNLSTLTGSCVLAAAAALQAPAASAIPINITSISGLWTDASPAGDITGVGSPFIFWGDPAAPNTEQSAYAFFNAGVPILNIAPDENFTIGQFVHNNFPITSPFLSTAELTVDVGFDVLDGGMVVGSETISAVFDFTHLESNNQADPCADGNPNGVAPNQNGCADRVTFEPSDNTEFFSIGGIDYFFNLNGFSEVLDGPFVDEFWTVENQQNVAFLNASYTIRESVPAPGVAWLFAAGLALVAAGRRRAASSQ